MAHQPAAFGFFLSLLMRALFVFAVASVCLFQTAEASLPKVDKLKAAYMYNFTRFISWPADHPQHLVFCVQQPTDFVAFFHALINSKLGRDKRNDLRIIELSAAARCDLAYLPGPQIDFPALTPATLIITDAPAPPGLAAVFTFYQEHNRLRFEIDTAQSERLNLTISSELLKVAKIK